MAKEFHKTDAEIALVITMTLLFLPVGGFVFGLMADRYGRRLPLMILGEHEAAQFRPEVTIDTGRQRSRHHVAIRRLPAFAAEIHHMRTDHQILHHEAGVTFEA